MTDLQWWKSSYSANNGNCVEVAAADPAELAEAWARTRGFRDIQVCTATPLAAFRAGYAAARAERDGHCRECAAGRPCEDHPDVKADTCPVEAVFPSGPIPCTFPRDHGGPHSYITRGKDHGTKASGKADV